MKVGQNACMNARVDGDDQISCRRLSGRHGLPLVLLDVLKTWLGLRFASDSHAT